MKIKTFSFYVSNFAVTSNEYGNTDKWDKKADRIFPVESNDSIDDTINNFIENKEVVNIIINDFTVDRHNNGKSDLIKRTYTIMYNENPRNKREYI